MSSSDFAELITLRQKSLYSYIYSLTGNNTISWDILQETNLVLWKKREEFQSGTNFEAWAFTVARFQCMAYFRDQKRDPNQLLTPEVLEAFGEEPDLELENQIPQLAALRHCHDLLKEKNQKLVRLYYYDKMSLEQIGNQLGTSTNSLKQALFRIRKSLRDCIDLQIQNTP